MIKNVLLVFCLLSISPLYTLKAQTDSGTCDFFEEQGGLLVIEIETLPLSESWGIDSTISGYTGNGYIRWTGSQYFNETGRGRIRFKVKINTPGIYRFDWRVAVGLGDEFTEHNDSWLKISADNFYAFKGTNSQVKPKPECNSDPDYSCPEGSTQGGFFKVYGGGVRSFRWQARTYDNNVHDINAVFDEAGEYDFEINARSSFHCIDRLSMYKINTVTSIIAKDLSNGPSDCLSPTSTTQLDEIAGLKIYPNPTQDQLTISRPNAETAQLELFELTGRLILQREINQAVHQLSIQDLANGSYWLRIRQGSTSTNKKIIVFH